jgi:hypothetical protein
LAVLNGDDVELGWLKAVCEWPTERPHSTGGGVVTLCTHVEIENRMSTTPSALQTKGSRNLLWLSPPVLRPRAMGFLPRSFLTGRRIRAAAESVEVFIDQTSHQSTVRRHAIRLQRRCGGNQRRPRSLRLDGVASTDQ